MEIRALLAAMSRNKTGPALVAAQAALTLAVLVNVAYVIEQRLQEAGKPTGMDLGNMFWLSTRASSTDYNYAAGVQTDVAYLGSLPGVIAATVINNVPQTDSSDDERFASNPQDLQKPEGGVEAMIYSGSGRLIDALGLKLAAGRGFSPQAVQPPAADAAQMVGSLRWAPEVIVTRAMAQKLFPDSQALGKPLYTGMLGKPAVIVGIVELMRPNPADARYDALLTRVVLQPIIPDGPDAAYVVRTAPGRRAAVMARLEREFPDLQPGRFIERMEDFDSTAAVARASYRATVIILGVAAGCVLLVTVIGIAGLAAFNVAARTRQLGTRRAIGARRFHILQYFLVESWLITTAGAAAGCILAVATGLEMARLLQMPRPPLYYLAGGVLLLWIVSLLAVWVPSLRAAAVPPAVATRSV